MKKISTLFTILLLSLIGNAQTPILTMIADGDCTGGNPKVIEIYASGTVDFTLYSIENQTNANTTWGATESLAALGTVTNEFVYVYLVGGAGVFATEYPSVTTNALTSSTTLNINGDDRVRIIETSTSTVIDQYGEEGIDGSGLAWEYMDGYAKRNNNTGPDAGFVAGNWTFYNGDLDGQGNCNSGTPYEDLIGIGSFTLAAGCNITSSGITALTCNNATTGADPLDDYLTFSLNPAGATLGTTYTVSIPTGTITPTTGTYGVATSFQLQAGSAGAGNVTVTITDDTDGACTFDQLITDPGACSSATPVITLTPASLTGFNHVVGTPSAEQTFTASGLALSADIEINAPTNFQISLTTGTGFTNMLTLPQTAGVVSATTIYARANAAAMGTLTGNIIATSTGADNDTVMVSGSADDYVTYMIEDINGLNANGVADSLDVLVSVTGVVQCGDYDYNAGYSFALIDGNGDGINIFRFSDLANYTSPMAGDSIIVRGKILQFNGLTEIQADSIQLVGTGAEADFMVVTTLSEATESMPIEIMGLTLVTPIATFTAGANIDATDGTNTIAIRIPSGSPLGGTAAPQGTFNITGIGWQFDSSSPYTTGYQIYPCAFEDVCTTPSNATTLTDPNTGMATATGVDYQWIDCADDSEISGATNQSFTAINTGSYAVIVTDGACSDTSDCITLLGTSGINENSILTAVNVYPNPVNDVLTINNSSENTLSYTILDVNGKVMTETTPLVSSTTVSTTNWNQGVYFVRFSSENGEAVLRVIK